MEPSPRVKPLHGYILVRSPEKEEIRTQGGIVIPDSVRQGDLKMGEVLEIGPSVLLSKGGPESDIHPGQTVLYDPRAEETIGIGDGRALIPYPTVLAILDEDQPDAHPKPTGEFFRVLEWTDFLGADHATWEQYHNLTLFSVKVAFLEPFAQDLKQLARRAHECCVGCLRGVPGLDLSSIQYATQDHLMLTVITDDVWHGIFTVDPKNSFIEFRKQPTDVPNVHRTAPRLLTALADTLRSPEFEQIGSQDFSRVTYVVFRFHQRIKIEGRGARRHDARNSELMQQFLLFAQKGNGHPTLDALALQSDTIGRIDMKISFQKVIDDHEYRVFLNVEAPANDEHTIIDIEWEIQDHHPGLVPTRQYGPLFTTFFRDVVMRSFYKRWFQENDDIVCSTSKR